MAKRNRKKQEQELSVTISNRINGLFFLVVLLFTGLILRLVDMQLINKAFYQGKLNVTSQYEVKTANPRGEIYDAKGRPLVTNTVRDVVAFTRPPQQTAQSLKTLAQNLAKLVPLTETEVSHRDQVDYYLADREVYREVVAQLPDDQKQDKLGNQLPEATIYANAVAAVGEADLTYSEEELKTIAIFSQMNGTPALDTVTLKTGDLSAEQVALISTAGADLPGLSVRTDWERQYSSNALTSLLGRISSSKTGLPAEEAEAYLAKGYALNDRVGTSYLEKSYETYLQGEKTIEQVSLGKEGQILSKRELQPGRPGRNLQLTVDLDFQEGVEDILESYFREELGLGHAYHSQGVYAVALNPNTGHVLAMAGIEQADEGELVKDALGTMTKVFTPGSVVKGATLAAGWENSVLFGDQVLTDQPIQLAVSNPINSWFTQGALDITAQQALEYSSNTYMVQVALKLMGQDYQPGMILATDGYEEAMAKLRDTYAQFGMGVKTGIDLPGESIGYLPEQFELGNVLTESFGQYDNYTTLQLAQYVATVANGGRRLAPRLVSGIYQSAVPKELGKQVESLPEQELNRVAISADDMAVIQYGFYQVVNGGAAYTTGQEIGRGAAVSISAKTGTAEAYVKTDGGDDVYTSNLNVVAYAPSHDPQIAVAVVFPNSTDLRGTVSHRITRDIINLYHSIHPMN